MRNFAAVERWLMATFGGAVVGVLTVLLALTGVFTVGTALLWGFSAMPSLTLTAVLGVWLAAYAAHRCSRGGK